jgi:enoyl-CoA hydratase
MEWEVNDDIAVLALEHGPVNALDREFLVDITETLRAIDKADVGALILSGKGPAFSAGADLYRVLQDGKKYVDSSVGALSDAFDSAFTFRRPIIAAVNGHAIAGGCIFVCASDYRVMAKGSGVIGLAELRVGVPFPTYALEIVRYAAAPQYLQELIYLGKNYSPEKALVRGLLDEVVEPDELMPRAQEIARKLAGIPRGTFELMKRELRAPTVEAVRRGSPEFDPQVQELWSSNDVRAAIERFLEELRNR